MTAMLTIQFRYFSYLMHPKFIMLRYFVFLFKSAKYTDYALQENEVQFIIFLQREHQLTNPQ